MHTMIFGFATFIGSIVWLVLLVATGFNVVTVGAGLLAAMYVTGRAQS